MRSLQPPGCKARISGKDRSEGGLFIETWVRKPDEKEPALAGLKKAVSQCNQEYIARVLAEANSAAAMQGNPDDTGEQGKLNRIVAGLNFD